MYYVTGDIHGDQEALQARLQMLPAPTDSLIVVGDFGVGFFGSPEYNEESFFDALAERDGLLLFLDGNHENFARLNAYDVIPWRGGQVHRIRDNILHLMRGEVYEIGGRRVFVMGGGVSLDKALRLPGKDWWAEEMPAEEEYERAVQNLKRFENRVDIILTHTAPSDTIAYLTRLSRGVKDTVPEEFRLTEFLSWVQGTVQYERWYFGHFHLDAELWKGQRVLLNDVLALYEIA